jgi:trehalose 6-phosphate phosphatase
MRQRTERSMASVLPNLQPDAAPELTIQDRMPGRRGGTTMPTLTPLWLALGEIAQRLRTAETLSIGTDYDGTLTPIVGHPDEARLSPRMRDVLEKLARAPGSSVAVASGRRIEDLQAVLQLDGVFLAGSGGLETLDPQGRRELHVPEGRELPPDLEPALREWCARFEGARLEPKGPIFSLHFRQVEPRLQPAFSSGVRRRLAAVASRARLIHGKKVFDVMPIVDWDKAAAFRLGLAPDRLPDLLFYFGDDTLDEPVHAFVTRSGGYAVAIDRIASRARYVLASPDELLWFLEWLEREWSRLVLDPNGRPLRTLQHTA